MFDRMTPIVKYVLYIAIAVFIITNVAAEYNSPVADVFALRNVFSTKFQYFQVITYMFAHANGSLMHIFFNMFIFVAFGSHLETYLGSKRFLQFIIICGIGVGIGWIGWQNIELWKAYKDMQAYLENPNYSDYIAFFRNNMPAALNNLSKNPQLENLIIIMENSPKDTEVLDLSKQSISVVFEQLKSVDNNMRGFSGVVFGIITLMALYFPENKIQLLFPPVPLKLKYLALGYIVIEMLYLINRVQDNVSHISHLLGVLFAVIMLKVWDYIDTRKA